MTVKHWNTGAAAARFRSQAASRKRQASSRKLTIIKKILKTNIKQWDETQHDPVEEFKLLVKIIDDKQ